MRTDELDYELPEELVARAPLPERDGARLLVVERDRGELAHARVVDLPTLLRPSLFVVNDTRVFPARARGHRVRAGGPVAVHGTPPPPNAELLFLEPMGESRSGRERWRAWGKPGRSLTAGTRVVVGGGALVAVVVERSGRELIVDVEADAAVVDVLERVGEVPLPPYLGRGPSPADRERYQTVFATHTGSAAAPTAGLHLSSALLDALGAAGHELARVTLHVGLGTFAPVEAERLDDHPMHRERYVVDEPAAAAIARARREDRPVIAVGTTAVRALESAVDEHGEVVPRRGDTRLFIRPPYEFRAVDGLLTNFHLPRSTLLALVMAITSEAHARAAYAAAIAARYRFFSYGDAMLAVRGRDLR